jgi:hypothetical protein
LGDNVNDFVIIRFDRPVDNVFGITPNAAFSALQTDVTSIPAYRQRIILQNGTVQLNQINALFTSYGY